MIRDLTFIGFNVIEPSLRTRNNPSKEALPAGIPLDSRVENFPRVIALRVLMAAGRPFLHSKTIRLALHLYFCSRHPTAMCADAHGLTGV
jgi:hypothetical protein